MEPPAMPPTLQSIDLPLGPCIRGKVRDSWDLGARRLIVTTDRQSAFDRVLGTVPFKGQILTAMTEWWFRRTADLLPNHLLDKPDPNCLLVRRALITPTTKAQDGGHDRPLSRAELVAEGWVPESVYQRMEAAALALFARGQALAAERGLILVDTKYEFGDCEGELLLVDEIHTVDSSRYWEAASYAERFAAGEEPETFDKEFLRRWYVDQGYRGEGEPPPLPAALAERMSRSYRAALERLTGEAFRPDEAPPEERILANLRRAGLLA